MTDDGLARVIDRIVLLERQMAVREETMRGVEIRLGKIEIILSRLTWLILAAIIAAAMAFVVGGGLRPPLM